MTRLILTTSDSGAGCLLQAGIADVVIPFGFRFVWGPLPSDANLAASLATRSTEHGSARPHWLDNFDRRYGQIRRLGLGLIELCQQCETVELWIGPEPRVDRAMTRLPARLVRNAEILEGLGFSSCEV